MVPKTKNLLREVSRPWELLIGWISAAISVTFAGLLVWLVYLVAWRNPREYGAHDLFEAGTFFIFLLLLVIAVGFSVLAFRLITRRAKYLLSPTLLRIWGAFFAVGSVVVLINCLASKKWSAILSSWEILVSSLMMAVAAFVLARKQERQVRKQIEEDKSAACEERVTKI